VRPSYRARQIVNALNGSTLLGLGLAKAYGARLERGPDGLVLARGARDGMPKADAFTIGNVILIRVEAPAPALLQHEARHATQWACCVLLFLPLYWLAAGWSLLRTGDHWSRNVFERRAGLRDGGYTERAPRPLLARRPAP
jgi:hypothetical protein